MIEQIGVADATTPISRIPAAASGPGVALSAPMAIAATGAVLGAVGSFLPWAKTGFLFVHTQVDGVDTTDGVVTFFASIAVAVCALLLSTPMSRWFAVGASVAGAAVALVATYNIGHYYDLRASGDLAASFVQLQAGIIITAAGGVVAVCGGLMALFARR